MLDKKKAIKGGVPLYKFIGNIVLTKLFNFICKTNFTDAHTGLWGYDLNIFKYINLNKINSAYNFDDHLRIGAVNYKFKIKEIPIETFYRSESSSYHIKYTLNFLKHLTSYILAKKLYL